MLNRKRSLLRKHTPEGFEFLKYQGIYCLFYGVLSLTEKQEWQHLYMLLKLAEMGAYRRTAKISTEFLAGKLGTRPTWARRTPACR